MTRQHYEVHCQRDGNWWFVQVPDVAGALSQARRLEHVEEMARDAIALVLEIDPMSFDLTVTPHLDDTNDALRDSLSESRCRLREAQQTVSNEQQTLVASVRRDYGLTLRDVAFLTGLSHQRIAQIEATADS